MISCHSLICRGHHNQENPRGHSADRCAFVRPTIDEGMFLSYFMHRVVEEFGGRIGDEN